MNHSGDAAEQIVRMSLEGVEVAAKITGNGAKEIALFLIAALKNKDKNLKLKGKARMTSMLKSGKALEIFSLKESDLRKFTQGAKQYGVVYCVLRNTKGSPDGLCDIMVKADDAPKISRLIERFHFATVDRAQIENEIVTERAGRSSENGQDVSIASTEQEAPDINDTEKLLNELLGSDEGKSEQEIIAKESDNAISATADNRPLADGGMTPPNINPSEPTYGSRKKQERTTLSKPSVKEELKEISAAKKTKETYAPKRDERTVKDKPRNSVTTHKQPKNVKSKSKKVKGNR